MLKNRYFMKNLPMDLLRAFVTVAEFKSFTKAGELLGRSQPAISLYKSIALNNF